MSHLTAKIIWICTGAASVWLGLLSIFGNVRPENVDDPESFLIGVAGYGLGVITLMMGFRR